MSAIDDFLSHYYARNPVNATFTGVHDFDALLPDWSRGARAREADEMRALRDRLDDEHPLPAGGAASLREDPVSLDAELARANLDIRLAEFESSFFHDRNPALWTGEAIFGAVSLMIRDFAPFAVRVASLTARLAATPAFLDGVQDTLTGAVPERWRARAIAECETAVDLFGEGLERWLAESRHDSTGTRDVTADEMSSLMAAALSARNAFEETRSYLHGLADAEDFRYGAGEDLLVTLVARGHFSRESPRELLARAETAMLAQREILGEMLASRGESWEDAQRAIAADRVDPEAFYDAFARRWLEIRQGVDAAAIVTWPEWPITYTPIPGWARPYAPKLYWLFYRSPAPFDPYDVYDYLVTPVDESVSVLDRTARLAAWNRPTITLNHVVHHGGLGHHVQNWHAIHRSSSRIGVIAAVDCASRIGMFLGGSMAEGWACYATELAGELGLLTPLELLSEQHTRVRLLARAIVDLRLHLGEWTFDECVSYYQDTVGMPHETAAAETTKNSMFPGTALMYWLGTDAIFTARERARAAARKSANGAGSELDLRAFHDALLSRGSIPVTLAAELMR